MAIAGFNTYAAAAGTGGSSNHEDLMDLITNISPTETPLFSELAKSPVETTYSKPFGVIKLGYMLETA